LISETVIVSCIVLLVGTGAVDLRDHAPRAIARKVWMPARLLFRGGHLQHDQAEGALVEARAQYPLGLRQGRAAITRGASRTTETEPEEVRMTAPTKMEIAEVKRQAVLNNPRAMEIARQDRELARALDDGADATLFKPFVQLDDRRDLPPFPVDLLPRSLADWARAAWWTEQVPLDIAAVLALGALSIAAMGRAKVEMFGGEPLQLYIVAVDRSGASTSGTFASAMRPVSAQAASVQGDLAGMIAGWEADEVLLKAEIEGPEGAETENA
jgi:hypothetical protein